MSKAMSISVRVGGNMSSKDHNERKKELDNIDKVLSKYNLQLAIEDIRDVYEREFTPGVNKYNSKQKRKDRRIDDYYSKVLHSKKYHVSQEIIFSVGDMYDYLLDKDKVKRDEKGNIVLDHRNMDFEKRNMAKDILVDTFSKFKEHNPNMKVFNATIHMDEATPHLHIMFVPVATGYKRGLEKQVSMTKAIENQGCKGKNNRERFTIWRENQVQIVRELMKEKGIERKRVGTKNYKNHYEYKEIMEKIEESISKLNEIEKEIENSSILKNTLRHELESISLSKNTLQKDLKAVKEDLKVVDIVEGDINLINQIRGSSVFFQKDKVKVNKDDFNKLSNIAKNSLLDTEKILLPYKNNIKKLEEEIKIEKLSISKLSRENTGLKESERELKVELNNTKSIISEKDSEIDTLNKDYKNIMEANSINFNYADELLKENMKLKKRLENYGEYKSFFQKNKSLITEKEDLEEYINENSLKNDFNEFLRNKYEKIYYDYEDEYERWLVQTLKVNNSNIQNPWDEKFKELKIILC